LRSRLRGPEVGDIGEVVIQFTPGRYVLGCVRRGREGHRHASTGEAKILVVTGRPHAELGMLRAIQVE